MSYSYRSGRSANFRSQSNHYRKYRSYKTGRGGNQGRNRNPGESLDPMMFVRKAVNLEPKPYVSTHQFTDFSLDERIQKNIRVRGYHQPTEIQDRGIEEMLKGHDFVGIANTGTGKTAAFLLPLINKVITNRQQRVLIVTPTRELAAQIQDELKKFSQGLDIGSVLCIGGTSINTQSKILLRRPSFVIGTPGRLKDLEQRRLLNLNCFNNVVLDEVDRMLDMGFIRDIRHLISKLPKERQSLFFSATLPKDTRQIMQEFLDNPIVVTATNGPTAKNVDQDIIRIQKQNKVEVLHDLLIKKEFTKVLVFGRTKWGVNKLEKSLVTRGFRVTSIHGNKSQNQRMRAIQMLKENRVQVLLATDVAARGLDIKDITHVINYDVPASYDDYVHRIGRTGRAGKTGVALTFIG